MTQIILASLFAVFVLIVVIIGTIWLMRVMLTRLVGDRHRQLEEITSSGRVPMDWAKKHHERMIKLNQQGAPSEKIEHVQREAKKNYLHQLKQLEKYVQRTNLVENEETRNILLRQLHHVRKQWEVSRADEL